jgi:hypothetical protein
MSFDDYIFTRPSFLGGVARAIDISGELGREAVKLSRTPAEADMRALASDFRVTNRDLHKALETLTADAAK